MSYGPTVPLSEEVHQTKYRSKGETFKEAMTRVADSLKDTDEHYNQFRSILLDMRFLPAGRVQAAMGSPRETTPYNCFVSGTITDDMEDIMEKAKEAALTMKKGGGIGYDFSTLRPSGALITTLDSHASGPLSFMDVYNSVCGTVSSAGHRRGAQMGVLRVDHPDIEDFITSKTNSHRLTNFNISVGVTDEFMEAVENDEDFELRFEGRVYKTVRARYLWDKLMRATWDWAEPGVLFIDKINRKNNLWYTELIAATNPCGEQPLPPYGACLLGSFNLTSYLRPSAMGSVSFEWEQFKHDIPSVVRAMDNIVDRAVYPLREQEEEATAKRRMGLGITGLANTAEVLGYPYASPEFISFMSLVLETLRDTAYMASIELAIEKGPFPMFQADNYLKSEFALTLPEDIRDLIEKHGIRNSHLLSIAPTGTISLSADNVSSGIEPVFSYGFDRTINMPDGTRTEKVEDWAVRNYGLKGKTSAECTVDDHVRVLVCASHYVDSACSKTCNIGEEVTWEEFKKVYFDAWKGGASGCTTFRAAGKRAGILQANRQEDVAEQETDEDLVVEGTACYIDPETGLRSCE